MHEIDAILARTLDDLRLSRSERKALDLLLAEDVDERELEVVRSRAFELARENLQEHRSGQMLEWLEDVMRALESAREPAEDAAPEAWFGPGLHCRQRLVGLLDAAETTVDVCVFAITDNTISQAVLAAHRRGVAVRIITDDDKVGDPGSDVAELAELGVAVAVDDSPAHMHHKFAIFDRRTVVTGSFNWTRSATTENNENIVVVRHPALVRRFQDEFDKLWKAFRRG